MFNLKTGQWVFLIVSSICFSAAKLTIQMKSEQKTKKKKKSVVVVEATN